MSIVRSIGPKIRYRLLAIAAVSIAVLSHIVFQFSMLFTRSDWSLSSFRDYYSSDQLSYGAIVANAAQGQTDAFEPFTETGSIYYPRAYYLLLGTVARLFHISPTAAWALGGLVCQIVLVAAISIACIVLSGKLWAGLLGGTPFVLGTLSMVTHQNWMTPMDSHAVLWGGFAVLYPLNAEAAGLCLGGTALLLLLLSYVRLKTHAGRVVGAIVGGAAIGLIANVQTYSFLTAVYFAANITAAIAVTVSRSRVAAIVSVALIPVVFVAGPLVARDASQLVALGFGLLPAAPGLLVAVIRSRGLVAWSGVAAVVFAAPSVVATAEGLREKDPFLVYRVVSSTNLGVVPVDGLIASSVLLLPLILLFIAGVRTRNTLWMAYPIGAISAWFIVATNDDWGANQEPYRLWIDGFLFTAVTLLPVALHALVSLLSRSADAPAKATASRKVVIAAVALVAVVAGVSSADFARFYLDNRHLGLIRFDSARDDAIGKAALAANGELIAVDTCVSPLALKIISGAPVAHMNFGMAWPTKVDAIKDLIIARQSDSEFDIKAAQSAGVAYLMTDDACDVDWASAYHSNLSDPQTFDYKADNGSSAIILWKFEP